jgi:hypothetical protein
LWSGLILAKNTSVTTSQISGEIQTELVTKTARELSRGDNIVERVRPDSMNWSIFPDSTNEGTRFKSFDMITSIYYISVTTFPDFAGQLSDGRWIPKLTEKSSRYGASVSDFRFVYVSFVHWTENLA